jgi:general secretion pathway protein K
MTGRPFLGATAARPQRRDSWDRRGQRGPNRQRCHHQRGAALLIAMLIVTLVATAAAAMVQHQQRAVEIEAAERARTQASLILAGALDWAKVMMRSDADKAFPPSAGWTRKLEESRLSSFLAADRDNSADGTLEVFLSGEIADAQGRYNLRRLFDDERKPQPKEVAALRRLCEAAGVGAAVADQLVAGLGAAWFTANTGSPVPPARVEQLAWLGIDEPTLRRLVPHLVLLPERTAVNANSATAPALLAAIDELDSGNALRVVQALQRNPAASVDALKALLPSTLTIEATRVGVTSRHFEVLGRLRFEDRVLEETWLLQRGSAGRGAEMVVLARERRSSHLGAQTLR